jgi:hypothetical protein
MRSGATALLPAAHANTHCRTSTFGSYLLQLTQLPATASRVDRQPLRSALLGAASDRHSPKPQLNGPLVGITHRADHSSSLMSMQMTSAGMPQAGLHAAVPAAGPRLMPVAVPTAPRLVGAAGAGAAGLRVVRGSDAGCAACIAVLALGGGAGCRCSLAGAGAVRMAVQVRQQAQVQHRWVPV